MFRVKHFYFVIFNSFLERNKREKWGELDIMVVAPDKTLVFIEVKTMMPGALKPEDQMSALKMKKFCRVVELYVNSHQETIKDKKGWRLDLMAIERKNGGQFVVRHYENVWGVGLFPQNMFQLR